MPRPFVTTWYYRIFKGINTIFEVVDQRVYFTYIQTRVRPYFRKSYPPQFNQPPPQQNKKKNSWSGHFELTSLPQLHCSLAISHHFLKILNKLRPKVKYKPSHFQVEIPTSNCSDPAIASMSAGPENILFLLQAFVFVHIRISISIRRVKLIALY